MAGGPFYKAYFPLANLFLANWEHLGAPIFLMGGGWKAEVGDDWDTICFRFQQKSLLTLKKIAKQSAFIGCRDYGSERVLRRAGIHNVLMTGCPAWYDLGGLGKSMALPKGLKGLAFTPAENQHLHSQSVEVMHLLRRLFPHIPIICAMHRGIDADLETPPKAAKDYSRLVAVAKGLGFYVIDMAYGGEEKMALYNDCELHIGYRAHAHIYFLSKRRPSILITEDARGAGVLEALGTPGCTGIIRSARFQIFQRLGLDSINGFLIRRLYRHNSRPNPNLPRQLRNLLAEEIDSHFARFARTAQVIDAYYMTMKRFVHSLP